ncbi:MAG: porin family protein [Acidobacteria bacterium]|nr:porin family protein [Acidobacteriota bacterium]
MKKLALFMFLAGTCTMLATAQARWYSFHPRVEIFGHLGSQSLFEDFYRTTELDYGAAIGVYITDNAEVEFDFSYASGFEQRVSISDGGSGFYLAEISRKHYWTEVNFLYHYVSDGPFRPYLLGGVGNAHRQVTEAPVEPIFVGGKQPPDEFVDYSENKFTYGFGTGAKIFLGKNFAIRFEYKYTGMGGDATHRVRGGISLLF